MKSDSVTTGTWGPEPARPVASGVSSGARRRTHDSAKTIPDKRKSKKKRKCSLGSRQHPKQELIQKQIMTKNRPKGTHEEQQQHVRPKNTQPQTNNAASVAHAASPRPLARTKEAKRLPGLDSHSQPPMRKITIQKNINCESCLNYKNILKYKHYKYDNYNKEI